MLCTCNINLKTSNSIIYQVLDDKSEGVVNPEGVEILFWKQIDCFSRFKFSLLSFHGLCHGTKPDVMSIFYQIIKKYRKIEFFCKFANSSLQDIALFWLSYLELNILTKAVWIAEHSLSFSRIVSYSYGSYLMNNPLSSPDAEI